MNPQNDVRRTEFFQNYRKTFEDRLVQPQVDSYVSIFDAFDLYEDGQLSTPAPYNRRDVLTWHLSYILATAYHEVGSSMQPLREGPWSLISKGIVVTDKTAREHVAWMYRKGLISTNYAEEDPETGHAYYGRGFVQLTWKRNYLRAGQMLGLGDLFVWQPDLVMNREYAAKILVFGMSKGIFTGVQLFQYLNSTEKNYYKARQIVNGLDQATKIKGLAEEFEKCIVLK